MGTAMADKHLDSVMNKIKDKQQARTSGKREVETAAYDRQNRRQNPPEHICQKMRGRENPELQPLDLSG